jgi:GNAT superfamily N-acetyltransferase
MIDEAIETPDPRARRALLDVLSLAFRDNPMNVAIHGPRAAHRVRANRAGLRALVLDSAEQTLSRVIRDQGRVVGGLIVCPPGEFPIISPSLARQIGCLFVQGGRAMERWSEVTSHMGQFHPNQAHWYLAVLGVVPACQGRGFGGRLIAELDRMVERNPHPVYLESDREASVEFYLRRGFEVREEQRLGGIRCWSLGRGFAGESGDLCDSVRESPNSE